MITKEYGFKSNTGVCDIFGCRYLPDDENVRAVLVIHHGMAEHQKRYYAFFEYLTSKGYAVYMHDMANHGRSNQNFSETGYFGKKDGYKNLVEDFKYSFQLAKSEYSDKKIIIMGHSMGSFVVRCFTAKYPRAGFDAAIYMGTGGSNPMAKAGDFLSALTARIKGDKYKSKTIDKLTFGAYNDKFEKRTSFDWLTRDTETVDKYINDKFCGFLFTVQGMNDLVKLNLLANSDSWYEKVPKDLPILLISGDMDPVGDYSKGIKEIKDKLKASGHINVDMKLYPQARHEVLNEINKNDVYEYINSFIEKNVL